MRPRPSAHHAPRSRRQGSFLALFSLLLLLSRRPCVDVVLVSPTPAWTGSDRGWGWWGRRCWRLRGRRRRSGLNGPGRRRRWRRRSRLHLGLPRRPSGVLNGRRRPPGPGACTWLLLGVCSRRSNPRDQGRASRSMRAGPPVLGRSCHDSTWNTGCGRPQQQKRMKRTLRQLEVKGRRGDRERLLPIARLERCAPEVAGRGRRSDKRRQSKRLSGDEHAPSMRFAPDGRATRRAARPGFCPAPSRGKEQRPPIAAARPPSGPERARPLRSWP